MLKKDDVKSVGLVTVGVLIAGFIMHKMTGIAVVDQSRAGFNYGGV